MRKTVLITGANRGLGKAFVDLLIRDEGCFIISMSRSISEDQKDYSPKQFFFLETDLSKNTVWEKLSSMHDLIGDEPLYFINNASIITPLVSVENLDEAAIDQTLSVNVKATMLITTFLLNNYATHKLTFVNISSGAANRAIRNWSLYCSSKACIQMFFGVAESEYPQHRFFNLDPGVMDTDMQKSLRSSDFPEVEKFIELRKEGKLKLPIDVAEEILKKIAIEI